MQVKVDEDIYTIAVVDTGIPGRSTGRKPIEALAVMIEVGTKIKFVKSIGDVSLFSEDLIGRLGTDEIVILKSIPKELKTVN